MSFVGNLVDEDTTMAKKGEDSTVDKSTSNGHIPTMPKSLTG